MSFLVTVARALGDLAERVVFIGGAISPLLQTSRPFSDPRPTYDVDAIAVTVSYTEFERLRGELRKRGFTEVREATHAHRWRTPGSDAIAFDLVPVGPHLGASGNIWDTVAVETAVKSQIEPGVEIRHASGPGFLVLKLAAFRDRGEADPYSSTDLEDILALVAARPQLLDEVAGSSSAVRGFIAEGARRISALDEIDDLLAGHLGNVARSRAHEVVSSVQRALTELGRCGGNGSA